jgi:alpha-L-fucosidase
MEINRREMLRWMGGACSVLALLRLPLAQSAAANPPFQPTRSSLHAYQIPDWFRDAKFGIWAHWGPQSAVEDGDWYARNMYIQGSDQYNYHMKIYGHPSKVGYKDLVDNWKAAKWDPDHLMSLYKKAGAKYFVSMGVHHDNFDLWNSKYTRWNAVKMGPKKDVLGMWRDAARKQGLRFGVSEHLWISYKWFAVSHGADKTGPLANVTYDGVDPRLRGPLSRRRFARAFASTMNLAFTDDGIPETWKTPLPGPHDRPDRQLPARPSLHRRPPPLRGVRTEAWWRTSTTWAPRLRGGRQPERSTPARKVTDCAVGTCLYATTSAASPKGSPRIPGRPTPASASGTTNAAIQYKTAEEGPRSARRTCGQQERQPAAEFSPAQLRRTRSPRRRRCWKGITAWMARSTARASISTRPWKIYGEGPSTKPRPKGTGNDSMPGSFNEDKQKAT